MVSSPEKGGDKFPQRLMVTAAPAVVQLKQCRSGVAEKRLCVDFAESGVMDNFARLMIANREGVVRPHHQFVESRFSSGEFQRVRVGQHRVEI